MAVIALGGAASNVPDPKEAKYYATLSDAGGLPPRGRCKRIEIADIIAFINTEKL